MGAWTVGRNLAGYLPESDVSAFAEDEYDEAVSFYLSEARDYADRDDEANDEHAESDWTDEDYGSMRATVDSIIRDGDDVHLGLTSGQRERGMIVRDNEDRPISFWLAWDDSAEADDES